MRCKEVQKQLAHYTTESDFSQVIRTHLLSCDNCLHSWNQLQSVDQLIEVEKNEKIAPFFTTRLEAAIEKNLHQESRLYTILKPKLAVILLMAGIITGLVIPYTFFPTTSYPMETDNSDFLFFEMTVEPNEIDVLNELI